MNAAWAAMLVWAILSWQGGLSFSELLLAGALLAFLVWRGRAAMPQWRHLGPTERLLWILLLFAFAGSALSLRPQISVNAASVLGLTLAAGIHLRRAAPGLRDGLPDFLLAGSTLYAAAFAGAGLLLLPWWCSCGAFDAIPLAKVFFPNQNLLAGGLAVPALLLGLARLAAVGRRGLWAQVLPWLALLSGLACVVYAGSRGAYVALAAGLLWLIVRWGPGRARLLWMSAVLVAVMGALTVRAPFSRLMARIRVESTPGVVSPMVGHADPNQGRRMDFYKGALKLSLQRPWTGFGLGTFAAAAYALDLPTSLTLREPIARYRLALEHAHDDWLELAVDLGWPATLALAACALAWLWRRWNSVEREPSILGLEALVVAAGATSLVDMNLRTPVLAWGLLLCFAAIEAKAQGSESPRAAGAAHLTLPGGLALSCAALALLCLLGCAFVEHYRLVSKSTHGPAGATVALPALVLQPLDANLAASLEEAGYSVPPWEGWAGRENPAWWWHAASLAAAQGRRDAQEADARTAIRLRPYFAPGYYWLALQLDHWGRQAEAKGLMQRALDLEPNFSRVLAWQADQALRSGDKAEARLCVSRVKKIQALRMADGRYDEYTTYIQKVDPAWLRSHPQS